jgi:uncharacterized protein YodC (DUF2158 family)
MSNNSLNVGDVVQLKSGGLKMTVKELRQNDIDVQCCWFDIDAKEVRHSDFDYRMLHTK